MGRKPTPPTEHTCAACGRAFLGRRQARTCSDRCRQQLRRSEPAQTRVTVSAPAHGKKTLRKLAESVLGRPLRCHEAVERWPGAEGSWDPADILLFDGEHLTVTRLSEVQKP